MSPKKIILLFVLALTSTLSFSQSSIEDQANALTNQVNVMLTAHDNNLKLSEDQTIKINNLYKALVIEKAQQNETIKDQNKRVIALYPKVLETTTAIEKLLTKEQLTQFHSFGAK